MGERLVICSYHTGQPGKKALFSQLFLRLKDWFTKVLSFSLLKELEAELC